MHNIILIDSLFYVSGGFALRSSHKKPKYRQVKKYYKSSSKYWKERDRRKLVLKLHEEGLSQKQIAERLGISVRTVKRDYAKVKPYYIRKIKHYNSMLEEEKAKESNLKGKSLPELARSLQAKFKLHQELGLTKNRQYRYHRLNFVLDLNNTVDGFPKLFTLPKGKVQFDFPLKISIFCIKGDRVVERGSISFSQDNPRLSNIW